jgi:hypothetical protein
MRRAQEDEEPDPADLEEERIKRRGARRPPVPCPKCFLGQCTGDCMNDARA